MATTAPYWLVEPVLQYKFRVETSNFVGEPKILGMSVGHWKHTYCIAALTATPGILPNNVHKVKKSSGRVGEPNLS